MKYNFRQPPITMWTMTILICTMLDMNPTFAQNNNSSDSSAIKTRKLSGSNFTDRGFGGVVVKFTTFDNQFAFMTGGRGAITINNRYTLGGAGYGIANSIRLTGSNADTIRNFKMGYGGLELGYIFFHGKKVNIGSSLLIAVGAAFLQNKPKTEGEKLIDNDFRIIPVLEPELYSLFTLNRFMRLHAGISYRYVNKTHLTYIKDQDIRGFSCSVGLLFGKSN